MERRLAAILAADAAGFTRLMERDEQACIRTLEVHRDVIESFIGAHRGRVFGHAGDAVIAEFQSAVDAVNATHDIQQELARAQDATASCGGMLFNIALNYSGRAEIVDAARRAIELRLDPAALDERRFGDLLYTSGQPIRTCSSARAASCA